jgi:RHS repeat-associated protein
MEIDNAFDAAGNRISTTPIGSGASPWTNTFLILSQFHYLNPDTDNFNRVAVADNSTAKNIITHEPDFLGLTTIIKYGDYAGPVSSVAHSYDKFLRLLTLLSSEANHFLNITLSRDFIGNIIGHSEPAMSPVPAINNSYVYDGMTRLPSGEGSSETYDELSNLVSQGAASYTYQDPNSPTGDQTRLETFNNGTLFTYSYDANGNPTSIANRFTSLSYDNLSMLRQIVYSQTDNYWYNDAGLRVKKTENAGGSGITTYTLFEGDNPLLQEVYAAAGRIQTTFNVIVGGRILAQYKMVYPSTLSVLYFYLDNLLSRRVSLDSSGAVMDRARYSAWGVATQDVGSEDVRSFTGKDYDASGLIYSNARYYDPLTGRFLTEDPSRKGVNWYAYCENNPINRTDPTGMLPVDYVANQQAAKQTSIFTGSSMITPPVLVPTRQEPPILAPFMPLVTTTVAVNPNTKTATVSSISTDFVYVTSVYKTTSVTSATLLVNGKPFSAGMLSPSPSFLRQGDVSLGEVQLSLPSNYRDLNMSVVTTTAYMVQTNSGAMAVNQQVDVPMRFSK